MDAQLHLLSRYHRHGDADAFCALVRDHAGMVFATAKRVTGDSALAEDVAQETFLALARSDHGTVESVAAWLHRVAWTKACNAIRGESRRRRHESAAAEVLHAAPDATWEELEPVIDTALEELPSHLREPLMAHYLQGNTQQELAARMGVSQSTISRQLETALQQLRVLLRARGVIGGGALATLLSTHTLQAAPPSLTTSLGKLAISGMGSSTTITTTLLAMTTTKILLGTAAVTAMIAIPAVMHQQLESPPVTAEKSASAASSVPQTNAKSQEPEHRSEPKHYRPSPVSAAQHQTVNAILLRHKGMTKAQLQQSAELNGLMNRFITTMSHPELTASIEERLAVIKGSKDTEHGTLTMDFDMLDDARGRAWLEAAVSNDPQLIEDWILNTLDNAIFEFAFDPELDRTTNGVSVQPQTPGRAEPEAASGANN